MHKKIQPRIIIGFYYFLRVFFAVDINNENVIYITLFIQFPVLYCLRYSAVSMRETDNAHDIMLQIFFWLHFFIFHSTQRIEWIFCAIFA